MQSLCLSTNLWKQIQFKQRDRKTLGPHTLHSHQKGLVYVSRYSQPQQPLAYENKPCESLQCLFLSKVPVRKGKKGAWMFLQELWGTGTGCPETLSMLHPWKCSWLGCMGLWVTLSSERFPAHGVPVGTGWSLKSLTTQTILCFYV